MRLRVWITAWLLLVGMLFLSPSFVQDACATTHYVGGAGPGNYTTIQSAIDAANPGDTVYVFNGTYSEQITIGKSLSLVGEDKNTTTIRSTMMGSVVSVSADWVNITGLTIGRQGPASVSGASIKLDTVANCSITNTVLSYMKSALWLAFSTHMTVQNNTIINGGVFLEGDSLDHWNTHRIDTSNKVNGKPLYYWKNVTGGSIPSDAGQAILANSTGIRVEDLNLTWTSAGVQIGFSSNITVIGSNVSDNVFGIWGVSSSNITIANNTALDCQYGMEVEDFHDSVIRSNLVLGSTLAMTFWYSRNITVHGNNISGLLSGIDLYYTNESTISNNTSLFNRWHGIRLSYSNGTAIRDNVVWKSEVGIGLRGSANSTIVGNSMVRTGIVISGNRLEHWNTHVIDTTNTVNGKPARYWKDTIGGTVPLGAGLVILANCSGVGVRDQDVSNTSVGIHLGFSSGIIITNATAQNSNFISMTVSRSDNNTITGSVVSSNRSIGYGISVEYSNDNLLSNNTVTSAWMGVFLINSAFNSIQNNEVSDSRYGIYMPYDWNNTISENDIHANEDGIHLHYSVNNTVESNEVHDNDVGIKIRQSDGNNVTRNNVSSNLFGIVASYAYGNRIYHNKLLGNTDQANDNRESDQWDNGYPSGGNYWSDYAGVDLKWGPDQNLSGSDGIGDTPYVIDSDSQDRYPLMMPSVPRARPPMSSEARLSGKALENITIEWLHSPDDGAGYYSVMRYEIYRGTAYDRDGFGYELLVSLPSRTTSFTDSYAGEGDPTNYSYRVCAIDRNDYTACAEGQAGKFTRPLSKGPNLISIPVIQSNKSIEQVLQTVEYDNAWTYDPSIQAWRLHTDERPYLASGKANHTMGIWINVTEDCNLTLAGIVPTQTSVQLYAGWNLVSFPSFNTTYTVADLKAETGATRVEGYELAPPYFLRVLTDGDVLQAGCGYWVKVDAPISWIVGNS